MMPSTQTKVNEKVASSADRAERLRREAEVLAAARHPGVVALIEDRSSDADAPTVVTAWAGSTTLATVGRLAVEESAGVVAAAADTIAALHEMGIVHGHVDASHVILSPAGMPILCGFGEGGAVATINASGVVLDESSDVHDLGVLLRDLVVDEGDVEPIPERPWWRGGLRPWTGYAQRSLLTIADRATEDDPERRPSAAMLAEQIRDAVPDAQLPAITTARDPYARLRRPRRNDEPTSSQSRYVTLGLAAVGVVLVAFALTGLQRSSSASMDAALTTTTTSATPRAPSPTTTLPPLPPPTTTDRTIVNGGHRYAIGEPGDVVVVGDWHCDGRPTVTVLRPSSGDVFRFTGWATADADVTVTPSMTVPGAVGLHNERTVAGCDRVVADLADGTTVELPA